jgi:hypothetical protein
MALTYAQFFAPSLLETGATTLFTVPAASGNVPILLKGMRVKLTNTSSTAASATIYAGTGTSTSQECLSSYSIPGNDYLDFDVPDLKSGDSLSASSGTGSVICISQLDGYLKT